MWYKLKNGTVVNLDKVKFLRISDHPIEKSKGYDYVLAIEFEDGYLVADKEEYKRLCRLLLEQDANE